MGKSSACGLEEEAPRHVSCATPSFQAIRADLGTTKHPQEPVALLLTRHWLDMTQAQEGRLRTCYAPMCEGTYTLQREKTRLWQSAGSSPHAWRAGNKADSSCRSQKRNATADGHFAVSAWQFPACRNNRNGPAIFNTDLSRSPFHLTHPPKNPLISLLP